MKIAIAGGSGSVGSRLVPKLLARGHDVRVWSRDAEALGRRVPKVEPVQWDGRSAPDVDGVDVVVNLAGANLNAKRWSDAYKRELVTSRVDMTRHLVAAIDRAADAPALVSANAVGYYGIAPEGRCDESRAPGDDFLARLCRDWQAAAEEAKGRVVVFRQGVILDPGGPVIRLLRPVYKMRLGGKIAGGRQPFPWVHHEDVTRAYVWAIEGEAKGVYNLTAPEASAQADFNRAMAKALGVCAVAPVPGFAIRLLKGEAASLITDGQEAPPARLLDAGFTFQHGSLGPAVQDVLG